MGPILQLTELWWQSYSPVLASQAENVDLNRANQNLKKKKKKILLIIRIQVTVKPFYIGLSLCQLMWNRLYVHLDMGKKRNRQNIFWTRESKALWRPDVPYLGFLLDLMITLLFAAGRELQQAGGKLIQWFVSLRLCSYCPSDGRGHVPVPHWVGDMGLSWCKDTETLWGVKMETEESKIKPSQDVAAKPSTHWNRFFNAVCSELINSGPDYGFLFVTLLHPWEYETQEVLWSVFAACLPHPDVWSSGRDALGDVPTSAGTYTGRSAWKEEVHICCIYQF